MSRFCSRQDSEGRLRWLGMLCDRIVCSQAGHCYCSLCCHLCCVYCTMDRQPSILMDPSVFFKFVDQFAHVFGWACVSVWCVFVTDCRFIPTPICPAKRQQNGCRPSVARQALYRGTEAGFERLDKQKRPDGLSIRC